MKASICRSAIYLSALLALPLAQAGEFQGRGVFHFASATGCPLATAGTPPSDCNRIALDDDGTRALLDEAGKTLELRNERDYPAQAVVGDLLLQGSALAESGQRVPVSLHLLVSKNGQQWSSSVHAHAPVKGDMRDVQLDVYQVSASVAGQPQLLLSREQALAALTSPSTAARLTKQFVQVRDNRVEAAKAEYADITVALGLEKAALPALRASLYVQGGHAGLDKALQGGTWSLELEALRSHLPQQVVERDLFLFGLDRQPLLQSLKADGFAKHGKLLLGAHDGKGYLSYQGQQVDLPEAGSVARAFLQESFIGLVLAGQQGAAVAVAQ
ncbi:hypothetical protein A9179_08205 [Pseudomonas alcaligenes]|uniref:DUF2066 domain-containing protein n=1 Tax=Aquipseudomonas alcaligenes TaxID=43263 RepID=A0ABR7RZG7_AQUAC|nr:hypothetical protein [Pseudomonas alcaligenes]MBC9250254.1 hypothetical protein [Pseudomonas alcaligenes]